MTRFYKISRVSSAPNAGLCGARRGDLNLQGRVVRDIMPGSYEIDVWDPGRRWPDLIHSLDCMLWSERVKDAFLNAGLTGVEFFPQKLREVDSKVLRMLPDPRYHWANALTGVPAVPYQRGDCVPKAGDVFNARDIDVSRAVIEPIDPATGFYDLSKGGMRLWKFDFSQWTGVDVFYISTVNTRFRFCTHRFKILVETHKFTNFQFTGAIDEEGNWFFV